MNIEDELPSIQRNYNKLDQSDIEIKQDQEEDTHESFSIAAKNIISDAIPSTMGLLFVFIAETINIMFIGRYNKAEMLAAIGIGTLYINATGYMMGSGMIGGLDTLCSHAFGNHNYIMIGIYVNITRIVVICFFILISLPFTYLSYPLLILIGQNEGVALIASEFCYSMLLSLFFVLQYNISLRYLQSMNIFKPGMFITLCTALLHPLWCHIFINILEYEVIGAGISMSITQLLNLLIISIYIHLSIPKKYPQTYFFINATVLKWEFFTEYLKKAIPSAILFAADMIGFEILTLMSSYINPNALAANVCLFNIISTIFMIPMGLSYATTTLVGNSIGGNKPNQAKLYTKAALSTAIIIIGTITLSVYFFKESIPYAYTSDLIIAELVTGLLGIYVFFSIMDAIQMILHGVIKGLGKQKIASFVVLIILYPINIPLAYTFCFIWNWGLKGLWYSQLISVFLMGVSFFFIIIYYDWNEISRKIIENLNEKKKLLEGKSEDNIKKLD
jgi:MATE family multidrug resistance protein